MKKTIFIISLVLVIGAVIGLCQYFFVFKSNSLSDEQARSMVIRMAIDAEAVDGDDYKDAHIFDLKSGNREGNIINKDLKSIDGIISNLTSEPVSVGDINYDSGITQFKNTLSVCASFFVKGVEQGKVYSLTHNSTVYKITYDIIGYEIFVTINSVEESVLVSFFYDATDNEYECVYLVSNGGTHEVIRFKSNSDGIISRELYSLADVANADLLAGINSGEGQTNITLIDYSNGLKKSGEFSKATSVDNHSLVSIYIHTIKSNYSSIEKSQFMLIDSTEKPIELK